MMIFGALSRFRPTGRARSGLAASRINRGYRMDAWHGL
jgi:hypothetical protein